MVSLQAIEQGRRAAAPGCRAIGLDRQKFAIIIEIAREKGGPAYDESDVRALIAQSALVCCSLLAGYLLVEVGYRAFAYASFHEQLRSAAGRAFIADKNSIFDEHTGYRYEPNFVDPNFRTNSHGLIAREEFPVEKPANEYRIGVIALLHGQ